MSGMFDWHVTGILSRTWREEIAPNPARFVALFDGPSGQVNVPQSELEGWHAALINGPVPADHVRFGTAYSPDLHALPQITISMNDEADDTQPLGYAGRNVNGKQVYTMTLREEVTIEIFAPLGDLVRALHMVMRGIMMSNSDDFIRLGYIGLQYMGGTDLMPEEDLMPGATRRPEVFARRQRWANISQPVWIGGALASGKPHVHAVDVVVDGIQGGAEGVPIADIPGT